MSVKNPLLTLGGCRIATRCVLLSLLGAFVSACAGTAGPSQAINDPDEAHNRQIHEFNKGVDRAILRPASRAYSVLPDPVERGVSNVAGNLDLPGDVVNSLLQGRPVAALENTARFAVNTTIGIGGLFDPARAMGLDGRQTDFGETLHVWGVSEGVYGEVPFLGPKTERDLVGSVVDVAMNPVRMILPTPERTYATAIKAGSKLGDRARYSDTIDSVLYESADSYAQTRLTHLQNRRFALGQNGGADDAFIDPYAADPYEDFDAR